MSDQPIIVNDSAIPSVLATALRAILTPLAATAATNGYLTGEQGEAIVGGAVTLAVVLWQLYVSWRKHEKLRTAADAAPSSVAQVK